MCNFELNDMLDTLREKRTSGEITRLIFEWVKIGRCNLRGFRMLLDWCVKSGINVGFIDK